MFEEPSLIHMHPALILHLFHLTKAENSWDQQVVQHPRDQWIAHMLHKLCTFWSSCFSGWHHLPHHSLQVLPCPHHLSTCSLCPIANPGCCSHLHFPAQRLFLLSPTSPFSQTFFPGKSPEAMHLPRFSICRTKLPPALLRARPVTAPLTAGIRQEWLSSVEDQHPFVYTLKPFRPVWSWAQLILSRGCRETPPRAAAPHAGSAETAARGGRGVSFSGGIPNTLGRVPVTRSG